MKLTPAMLVARKVAGYHPPAEDEVCCSRCGAARHATDCFIRYYCARHMFYVHSKGWCPKFDPSPYNSPEPKKSPYVQTEISFSQTTPDKEVL